jgi:hypothetical protein
LNNSIDFYSLHKQSYSTSCPYDADREATYKQPVELKFLDERTIIAGHCDGHLVIATQGVWHEPNCLKFAEAESCEWLLTMKVCLSKWYFFAATQTVVQSMAI